MDVSNNLVVPRTHFTFLEIKEDFGNTYTTDEDNNSTICDVIALYVKGQKILYTEAKTHCEQRLTFLMLPAILITVLCSVLSTVLKDEAYGTTITSSLNGLNAFILALINYLKLDTRAEAHRTSAYKFDKLESKLQFSSGKLMYNSDFSSELGKVIDDAETQVREIKETNQFVLPEKIRYSYPRLYNTNLFAEVKRINVQEAILLEKLKNLQNDVLALKRIDENNEQIIVKKTAITATINDILHINNDFHRLSEEFIGEIKQNRSYACYYCTPCGWFKV
jgi:uncharacterized protein (UPF0305 family)